MLLGRLGAHALVDCALQSQSILCRLELYLEVSRLTFALCMRRPEREARGHVGLAALAPARLRRLELFQLLLAHLRLGHQHALQTARRLELRARRLELGPRGG